ncbi:MAG: prepilin-type N-terminal cleavage/methylation domain-containing protein [Cyanobacterium sp. T60_A2020_053]|nr:prepilin-type N-terminal cleavage/methylation domain-containing protein [Cyanobacterium sp. T60_A2020_053]
MDKQNQYTQFKRYLLALFPPKITNSESQQGITMIEMIASMLISSLVVAFAFNGFAYYRQSFLRDQSRNRVNQSFGGVSTLIGPDILQIGEGLTDDPRFPAVEVRQTPIPGTDPVENSSEILIRKAVITDSLPLCADITAGTSTNVLIFDDTGGGEPGCDLIDNDGDGVPDLLANWSRNRQTRGGTVRAYIYDGASDWEFFDYTGEITQDGSGNVITPSGSNPAELALLTTNSHTWANNYSASGSSKIYIIEERLYRLSRSAGEESGTLQLIVDRNTANPLDLASNIENFEILINVAEDAQATTTFNCTVIPPTVQAHCPDYTNFADYSWAQIQDIQVTTTLNLDDEDLPQNVEFREEDLRLTEKFFPRNVFSF